MAETASAKFSVKATDEASPTLKKIGREVGDLGKNAGKPIDLSSLTDSLSGLGSAGGIASGLGDLVGKALPVAGMGIAAAAVANVGWELGKTGASAMRTRDSFLGMAEGAGISAQRLLSSMRDATAGTVADSDLMLAANRALMLGVATNAKDMAGLMAAAVERGRSLGVSAGQAVSDIITGIGRMSPQILDNLGIVGAAAAFDKYAASLGTTADKLTDVQKKQALVNTVLASSSGATVANDAASAFERMDASMTNAKESLGILFGPAIAALANQIAQAAAGVADGLDADGIAAAETKWADLSAELATAREELQRLESLQGSMAGVEPGFLPPDLQSIDPRDLAGQVAAQAALADKLNAQVNAARNAANELKGLKEATAQTKAEAWAAAATWQTFATTVDNAPFLEAISKLDALGTVAAASATDVNTLNAAVSALSAKMSGMAPIFGKVQSMRQGAISALEGKALAAAAVPGADVAAIREQYAAAADEIWNMPLALDATNQAMFDNQMAVTGAANELGGAYFDSIVAADQAGKKLASGSLKDMNAAFDDLRGKVSGVLGQATNLNADWTGKDANAGNHDTSENAYRMAAIANEGLIGQSWLPDLAKEAPGAYADLMLKIAEGMDAKSAAQSIMADFEDGLRPDMINQDAVKDRVRRMILGDQATSAMADQIAQELSTELGVSLSAAQSATSAVLGKKPAGDAASLADGLASATNGKELINQIATQMEATAERMRTAGNSGGVAWGSGFMATVETSVGTPLINLLVALVTPGVLAAFAAEQSQQGAK